MSRLDFLIENETECTYLDFKAIQYQPSKHEDLLKDIMAMANAPIEHDRYIVVGVNYKDSGQRDIIGVSKNDFVDSARYQQLVRENIEPSISFDYFPYSVEKKTVGVFKIHGCDDQPYMMRKEFRDLRKGEAWVRNGDSQDPMVRRDLDRMIAHREHQEDFDSSVRIGFAQGGAPQQIELPAIGKFEFPSEKKAAKIKRILRKKRESVSKKTSPLGQLDISGIGTAFYPFGGAPYEQRSIEELEKALKNVKETYREDDMHSLLELNARKINFRIHNHSGEYLEDTTFIAEVPVSDGLVLAERIHHKPEHGGPLELPRFNPAVLDGIQGNGYPEVEVHEDYYLVKQVQGDIKHHLPSTAFGKSLRLVLGNPLIGRTIEIKTHLHAKNMREPIERTCKVVVTEPSLPDR